jgi:hypothetical protein
VSRHVIPEAVARVLTFHQEDVREGIDKLKSRLTLEKKKLVTISAGKNIVSKIDLLNLSEDEKTAALDVFGDVVEGYNEQVNVIGSLMTLIDKVQLEANIVNSYVKEYLPSGPTSCSDSACDEPLMFPEEQA